MPTSRLRSLWREPLLHFLLAGAALFLLHRILGADRPDPSPVVIDDAFLRELEATRARQSGRPPEAEERAALLRAFIREEVLVREARALGLDLGDPIIRRRLVQKMELVLEARVEIPAPTRADLEAYRDAHPERYREGPRLSFEHAVFGRDGRGAPRRDALDALDALREGADPASIGDPFPGGRDVVSETPAAVDARFGDGFAARVAGLPEGRWAGPVPSAFGFHLVRVGQRDPGRPSALAEIEAEVRADWARDATDEAREAAVRALIDRTPVVRR
ncbi:MAG: peptidyl-prolyl cis-trans isomerase [Sandaracinaceae bacterium]